MLPALGSLLVIAIKDSAIASVIAVPELMRQSQILAGKTFRPFEIYTVRDAGLFPALLSGRARRSTALYRRVAPSGLVMTFDWSVVWSSLPLLLRRRLDDHLA